MLAASHNHDDDRIRIIAERNIIEKLDGKEAKVAMVEVTIVAGQDGAPHRHPGPVFGYVLEGEYELGIDDQPTKIVKQGETFYEPTGCLHRVSKNPSAKEKTRVLAVVVQPRDAKAVAIPEPNPQ
jgi:quercetin dioxygenase-like cupin family protein